MENSVTTMKSMYSVIIPYIKRHSETKIIELSFSGKEGYVSKVTSVVMGHVKY